VSLCVFFVFFPRLDVFQIAPIIAIGDQAVHLALSVVEALEQCAGQLDWIAIVLREVVHSRACTWDRKATDRRRLETKMK
jgi:hypothetical protein